jgi:hypothetical protein
VTAFASLAGAFVAALQASPAVSPHVYRARMRVLPQAWTSCTVVRLEQAEVQRGAGQGVAMVWETRVAVECYARAPATTAPDVAVDALLGQVVARVMADPTLAGAAGDVGLAGISYDFDVDADSTALATVTFIVRHATPATSILN